MTFDPLTAIPLYCEPLQGGEQLGCATSFVVQQEERAFLVTNWHVMAGRDWFTKAPLSRFGSIPNQLRVWHHSAATFGEWVEVTYALVDAAGSAVFRSHPNADVLRR